MLTRTLVEDAIIAISDALERLTDEYAVACDEQAEAEIGWRSLADATVARLAVTAERTGHPVPHDIVLERTARARHRDEHDRWVIAKARRDSLANATRVHIARLDALRTLSASVRSQT